MMSQMTRSLRLFLLFLAVAAVSALAACLHLLRPVPEHFNFSHQQHVAEQKVECLTCHGDIPQSSDARTRDLPTMETCQGCHEQEIAGQDCGACHIDSERLRQAKGQEEIPRLLRYEHPLNYSHAAHLPRVEGDCLACHAQVVESTRSRDEKLPQMAACMGCHQQDYDGLYCSKCHSDLTDPRYGPELGRFAHRGDWLRTHQLHAEQQGGEACAQCHQEDFCADCHSGVDNQVKVATKWPRRLDRHFIHRGDYVSRHRTDAERDSQQCFGCHRLNTCSDCHAQAGVRFVAGGDDPFGGNHPIVGVAAGLHDTTAKGIAAIRRNIVRCAACHEGDRPVCVNCHAETGQGGLGINPHPAGFKSTFNPNNREVCRTCHVQ